MLKRFATLFGLIVTAAVGCGPNRPTGPGVGANVDPQVKADELKALAGTWAYERQVVEGKEITGMGKGDIIISGDSLVREIYTTDGRQLPSVRATIWIDPTTTPKQIDQDNATPSGGAKRRPGIYKLEGDRLTLCWNNSTDQRPQTFESPPGSTFVLSVLRRQGAK